MVRNYKELEVWKKSVAITTEIYRLSSSFPNTERYGLSSQVRKAAVSVAANTAEGWGRGSVGEYIQFLTIARGSLMELETYLIISCNLELIGSDVLGALSNEIEEIGKMLNGLIGALKSRKARV